MVVKESNAIGTAILRWEFCIVIAISFILIIDLDRPKGGLIKIGQESMIDLMTILNSGEN